MTKQEMAKVYAELKQDQALGALSSEDMQTLEFAFMAGFDNAVHVINAGIDRINDNSKLCSQATKEDRARKGAYVDSSIILMQILRDANV